jgi:YjbE family integral membrane protein
VPGAEFWIGLLQIIGIDLILSADNAVMLALVSRSVAEGRRHAAMAFGAAAAVALRVAMVVLVFELLLLPYVKLVAGLLLLWVAVKLGRKRAGARPGDPPPETSLAKAVRTILVVDAIMSLDNIVGIAGAAKGSYVLLALGLAFSIPLVISGGSLVLRLLARIPSLVAAGSGLIGWVAGDMIWADPVTQGSLARDWPVLGYLLPLLGIAIGVAGAVLARSKPLA